MPLLLTIFVQICLPIMVLAGIGWVLDQRFRLDLRTLIKLNMNLVVPAFIFVQVVQSPIPGGEAVRVVGFTLLLMACLFVVAELYGRLRREPLAGRRSLQLATMFYNSGNYGIPLIALAYPLTGPPVQIFVLLTQNLSTFSLGLVLASSGRGIRGWKRWLPVLRQATLWAAGLALLVRAFQVPVKDWGWFWTPLQYVSNALIAVALVTLGVQLSQTDHTGLLRRVRPALVLRLIVAPLLAVLLVRVLGFHGDTAAVLILGAGVPTAVNIALLSHEFGADHPYLAGAVFYSTLVSMATVTFIATLLRVFPA